MFSQSRQVALCHLVDEFVSLSSVVDFSEGFLCLECGDSIDLITGNHRNVVFDYVDLNSKLFCINNDRVVVAVDHQHIRFLDMDSGALLGRSFQRYLASNLLIQTKFSHNGLMLAFPKISGSIKFLSLLIPSNPLLSEIKEKAASEFGEMKDFLCSLLEGMWKL